MSRRAPFNGEWKMENWLAPESSYGKNYFEKYLEIKNKVIYLQRY
jgi:hypothetical protein